MMRLNNAYTLCLALIMTTLLASSVYSMSLKIVDQNGQVLPDAVIVVSSVKALIADGPAVMDQIQSQFSPAVMTVAAGQAVSFPNSDNIRHHVYSFSKGNAFEIQLYSGSPSEPLLFSSPGIVVLGCNIHDGMLGYILVTDGSWSAVSDQNGHVELPTGLSTLNESMDIQYWHPRLKKDSKNLHFLTFPANSKEKEFIELVLDVRFVKKKKDSTFKKRYKK